ncbi:MAG: winged helix-turn-helix domain-containing protein [Steroidobacteraceae bacterium]
MNSVTPSEVLTFGPWRLHRQSGELHRGAERVALQEQPFRVLELLVLRAGEVVTREELIAHVWPRGAVIDFDTGLNTAIRKLRQVLEDDAEQPRFIQTLPRRGYRFLPQAEPEPEPEPIGALEPTEPSLPPPARVPWRWMTGVAVALAIAFGVVFWLPRDVPAVAPASGGAQALPRNSIAVLPFRRLGADAADDTLALGLAESVLHQLSTSPDLRVIARTSSFSFRDPEADFAAIGRKLGARYLLDGALQTVDGQLRLTTRLIDASNDRTLWSLRFDRRVADVFALQDEIALQVARILRVSVAGSGLHVAEAQGTGDVDAYFDYLQGRNLTVSRRVADLRQAEQHLLDATRRDPQFAAALAELARARELLLTYDPPSSPDVKHARFQAAQANARRALELAPDSPAALVAVGTMTEDTQASLGYLRRAIAINPNYALAWLQIAEHLVGKASDDPQALPAIDTALRLDPLEPRLHYLKGLYYFLQRGDTESASKQFRATLEVNPEYYVALARLAQMEACCSGRHAEAVRYAEQALRLDPQARWVRRLLVSLYLDLGDLAAAEEVARDATTPDAGSLLLIDLRKGRKVEAVGRIADPANAANWMSYETSEGAFFGRVALLDPGNAAAFKESLAWAEEEILPGAPGHQQPLPDVVLGRVNRAVLLRQLGRDEEAASDVEQALALSEGMSGLLRRLPELRAVALSLDQRRDEAIAQLETGHAGLWSYWWYYADLEPGLAGVRGDARFTAWRDRLEKKAAVEREQLRAMRVAGVVPARGSAG